MAIYGIFVDDEMKCVAYSPKEALIKRDWWMGQLGTKDYKKVTAKKIAKA